VIYVIKVAKFGASKRRVPQNKQNKNEREIEWKENPGDSKRTELEISKNVAYTARALTPFRIVLSGNILLSLPIIHVVTSTFNINTIMLRHLHMQNIRVFKVFQHI
jgi:hypothetical protein